MYILTYMLCLNSVFFVSYSGNSAILARLHIFVNGQLMPQEQQSVSVIERQPVILRCESNGTFTNFRWAVFMSGGFDFKRSVFSDTIQFDSIVRDQQGRYACSGFIFEDIFEENFFEFVSIKVDVMYPPENPVIIGTLTTLEGENVNLTCQADSNPESTFLWLDRDRPDGEVLARGNVFAAPIEQPGVLFCIVENFMQSTFGDSVTSRVAKRIGVLIQVPASISELQDTYTFSVVDTIDITCEVIGTPLPKVWWTYYNDNLIVHNGSRLIVQSSYLSNQSGNSHYFTCYAENVILHDSGILETVMVEQTTLIVFTDNKDPTLQCNCSTNYTGTKESDIDSIVISTGTFYGLISAAVVGLLVALVIMVIMAYVCVKFRRFRKRIGKNNSKSWYRPELPKRHVSRDEDCQSNHTYIDLRETRASHQGTNHGMKDIKENNDVYLTPTFQGQTKATSLGPDKTVNPQFHYDVISDSLDRRQTNSVNKKKEKL